MNPKSLSTEDLVRLAPYGNAWLEEMRRRLREGLDAPDAPDPSVTDLVRGNSFLNGYDQGYTDGYETAVQERGLDELTAQAQDLKMGYE